MPSKSKQSKAMKRKNNGSKKKKTVQQSVAEQVPVVEATVVEESAPVVETPVVETAPVKQKGGSRRKGNKQAAEAPVAAPVTETEQVTEAFTEVPTETVTEVNTETQERRTRSFKVLLPNSSDYEGRFTGLTPYQAANKALSKYYRETNKPKKEIRFSIRESTRGSKRSVYTYNGRREKLKVPVEYSIKDGRTIVKHYKNRLIKVKKAELVSTETATSSA